MEKIKQHFFQHFNTLFILSTVSGACLFLLMVRLKITHSFFFLFLVWNLFLAAIPFLVSSYLIQRKKLSKIAFGFGFLIWLLFLPNAPYIITDLIHLRHSGSTQIWLDIAMIGLFALGGLLFYLYSLRQMHQLLLRFSSGPPAGKAGTSTQRILWLIPFLVGFGIYLGRVLRWNSWDIAQNPSLLVQDVVQLSIHPIQNIDAWLFTFAFGIGLNLAYKFFNSIIPYPKESEYKTS